MAVLYMAPVAYSRTYQWNTNVLRAYDGTQQRIALRKDPRTVIKASYVLKDAAEIQIWNDILFNQLDNVHTIPLWDEQVPMTAALSASDTTITANFAGMDTDFYDFGLLISTDGETYESVFESTRNSTTITTTPGLTNNYPAGSSYYPQMRCYIEGTPEIQRHTNNSALLNVTLVSEVNRELEGAGAPSITTYKTKNVLDRRHNSPGTVGSSFVNTRSKLDLEGAIEIIRTQQFSNISTNRAYTYRGNAQRQWWKAFLIAARGMRNAFYAPTYRPDMVVVSPPSVGGSTLLVYDDSDLAGIWANSTGHADIYIETQGGNHAAEITFVTDNLDGTLDVGFTPALPASSPWTVISNVSFLELCHLGNDEVEITTNNRIHTIEIALETIEE